MLTASMAQLVDFKLEEGGSILVEVEEQTREPVTRRGRPAEAVTQAAESLEQVLGRLGPAMKGIVSELRAAADGPEEVEIEFGVKLATDANVIIARTSGEANFRIALKWSRAER